KSNASKNLEGYFLSNRNMPWYLVLLGIMGTQASAITFLSAPGQAYTDGMRFVQYYFGLPIAMVILSITFVPLFHKLKVYTAYEFLEQRFDVKTRTFTSFLFLLSRGLSTGISIYAPSIILSSILGWDIFWTNIFMGGLLIIYTVTGGAKAVAYTQQLQLAIIFFGMGLAAYYMIQGMPAGFGVKDALEVGGAAGKMNIITTGFTEEGFNWKDKYNIISGILGGLFLALSYFGTDQSQVGRYITAKDTQESKLGLLMNGMVKIPMQFLILLIGIFMFTFYQFVDAPIFFNQVEEKKLLSSPKQVEAIQIKKQFDITQNAKQQALLRWKVEPEKAKSDWLQLNTTSDSLRKSYQALMKLPDVQADSNDTNYIFIRFVIDYLPRGWVGLLIAIIFLAAWGSIAAALNSLASSTMVDFYQRFRKQNKQEDSGNSDYRLSKWITFGWGIFCIAVAQFASGMGSLIEAVNVLGSLFYGVMLGIFLVAFYVKSIKGTAVFYAAIIGEFVVVALYLMDYYNIIGLGFLWLNVAGALVVILLGMLFQSFLASNRNA
nr:sodium:solute symporter [Sediminibacterium sp.]